VTRPLVFDNTPLSHFARAGRLDTLGLLVEGQVCVTTAEVRTELLAGASLHPELAEALILPWMGSVDLLAMNEIELFAQYKAELGGGTSRNMGEAAVLAWARVHAAVVLIDERVGARIAQRDGIEVHGSLWLVVNGVRRRVLTRRQAEVLVDELADTDMRLPTDGKGLFAWAQDKGLLP
jgi:predicted nucleic acid-binding protein